MEQTVEQFWVRGEAATMAHWVLALPQPLVREHARLLLTTALYLLNTVTQTPVSSAPGSTPRCGSSWHGSKPPCGCEMRPAADLGSQVQASASREPDAHAAEDALLHRRLRLLRLFLAVSEATATGEFERVSSMQQEIEEELEQDEEAIWQMVPLACSFLLHYTVRQEGAQPGATAAGRQRAGEPVGKPLCGHQGQAMAGLGGGGGGTTAPGL